MPEILYAAGVNRLSDKVVPVVPATPKVRESPEDGTTLNPLTALKFAVELPTQVSVAACNDWPEKSAPAALIAANAMCGRTKHFDLCARFLNVDLVKT